MATVTPSKVAASALENISLSASKTAEPNMLTKLKAAAAIEAGIAPEPIKESKNKKLVVKMTPAELKKRFVGDLDCEEKDEPILKESADRFVLFPIRYREVSFVSSK
jgi:ribonucleoside-diphosphate reductase subunit M2